MKYLVVLSKANKSWAIGVDIAVRRKNEGHEVVVLDVSSVFTFSLRSQSRIDIERDLSERGIKNIKVRKFSLVFLKTTLILLQNYRCFFQPINFSKAKFLEVWPFIYNAVQARLSQTMGTRYFSFSDVPRRHLFKHVFSAIFAALYCNDFLEKNHFDSLAVFNGREPTESIWIRKFLDMGAIVEIHERASSDEKCEIYRISPHFHPEWWEKIDAFKSEMTSRTNESKDLDRKYIENKLNGFDSFLEQKWSQYYVPEEASIEIEGEYVVFFATSTFEYSPITEFENALGFSDQIDALLCLKSACSKLGFKLIVRRHPSSLSPFNGKDYEKDLWDKIRDENTLIFAPREKVNSHLLAKKARVCFVWRSGIGIETIALGIPTYALGTAKWAVDVKSRAWSEKSVLQSIKTPQRLPLDRFSSYIGYMARGGINLSYFKSINRNFAITTKNKRVYPHVFSKYVAQLSYFKQSWFPKRKA